MTTLTPEDCRRRARELREQALRLTDSETRGALRRAAEEYEKLAHAIEDSGT